MLREAEGIGKTYDEALKNALAQIGLKKDEVDIQLIEEPKKRLFSILEVRQVRVKVTEIGKKEERNIERKYEEVSFSDEEIKEYTDLAGKFVKEFLEKLDVSLKYVIKYEDNMLKIDMNGEKSGLIIGYRGETLDALQNILTSIINKNKEKHMRILVDIEDYRKKRIKALEELALKMANIVISKRKNITLEPMVPFERRIIHTTLQNHPKVKSDSIGEEPYRKVIISLK